jgi:lipoprotein Spr/probable lipoprotein NlpC
MEILNQLWKVTQVVARLLWLVLRGIYFALSAISRYLYQHRVQIAEHKLTLPGLVTITVLWSGFRAYTYVNQPHSDQPIYTEATMPDSVFAEQYVHLTSLPPTKQSSQALVTSIQGWLGTPHRDGGESKSGTDCSGFVRAVYNEAYGIELSRNSLRMYEEDVDLIDKEDLQEGDLVFFDTYGSGISHVGIYLLNNRFVHTSSSKGVVVDSLTSAYYTRNYVGSGRVKKLSY